MSQPVAPVPHRPDPQEPAPVTEGHPLDNAVWNALTTVHRPFAEGSGGARRYHRDVSVFWALQDRSEGAWQALAELAAPDDHVVLFRDEVDPPPAGWSVVQEGRGVQMVLPGPVPDVPPPSGTRPLGDEDVEEMLALVDLTAPGPFSSRTIELGGYVGVFEDGRLLAMAGERMALPGHVEVSAVCTHPGARRRGYGAALTALVARGIAARGDVPFLHVVDGNDGARRVYQELGFVARSEVGFAILRPPSARLTTSPPSPPPSRDQRRQAR